MYTICFLFLTDYISIGWESPAGQTYASAADLGKLMTLLFNSDEEYNLRGGQVCCAADTVLFAGRSAVL